MALRPITLPESGNREAEILGRLLHLYDEERQVYLRVRDLTREQLRQISRGAPLGDVRRILEQKKASLEVIGRLELTERHTKATWERERSTWSGNSRARLHSALQTVTEIIEEILTVEEQCDRILIEQAQVV